GPYALSWKPCQGDSLNLPDHRYIADVVASFQRSQIHIIKLSMSNHCMGRLLVLRNYKSSSNVKIKITKHECLKPLQIKTTHHKKLSINQECQVIRSKDRVLDIGGVLRFKTSTLGEIVSFEKSNKNINGLHPTSQFWVFGYWIFEYLWYNKRDFAKPVKAISLPQDVPSTFDHRLIELENKVQCLMKAHLAPMQPTEVNKITSSGEICSGSYDTQYCMENPKQAFVEYASLRTDEA
nr:MAK10-like protein [Tanacetum cinerariifolium]